MSRKRFKTMVSIKRSDQTKANLEKRKNKLKIQFTQQIIVTQNSNLISAWGLFNNSQKLTSFN